MHFLRESLKVVTFMPATLTTSLHTFTKSLSPPRVPRRRTDLPHHRVPSRVPELGALLTHAAAGHLEVSEIQRFGPAGAEQLQARCTLRSVLRRLQGWLVMSG